MEFNYKGFMEDAGKYIEKNQVYGRRGFLCIAGLLTSALLGCKTKEKKIVKEESELIYTEDGGMKAMMDKCEDLGLKVTENEARKPRYIFLEGKQTETTPDFFIEFRGKYDALYGEFVSLQEGPEGLERAAIDKYNQTEKEPEGKTVIVDKGQTEKVIGDKTGSQLREFGVIG